MERKGAPAMLSYGGRGAREKGAKTHLPTTQSIQNIHKESRIKRTILSSVCIHSPHGSGLQSSLSPDFTWLLLDMRDLFAMSALGSPPLLMVRVIWLSSIRS